MKIVSLSIISVEERKEFFFEHWGSEEMVLSSGIFQCSTLPGFACMLDENIIGLVSYFERQEYLEVISLDARNEGKGIGSKLLYEVEQLALTLGKKYISLITTNDNIRAIAFYQKRGYRLIEIKENAVNEARKMKPNIPLVAQNGIPIIDEIVLKKVLY
ncbi:GNAT family N-acetyltransferase [Falsibacillus albus]|uniref:GNAT family N-acetyltransferase n=1 Tax=Falsibacillus albus TaxID=2478915 RepID=A0A3L7K4A5_9BACI|nr:GNAT family N-acetyltransferase [Falsibacillus albus]RLQ97124.1 GNAT family N-acetyltransferase [Falsibacillus albus]